MVSEIRKRVRASAPELPYSTIDCFTKVAKAPTYELGEPAEKRAGFTGKVARVDNGPAYRAWAWDKRQYIYLGQFSYFGEATEALRIAHTKNHIPLRRKKS